MATPVRLILSGFIALVAASVAGAVGFVLTFYVVAGGGQYLDPAAAGDQYIFIGGVAAMFLAPLCAVLAGVGGGVGTWRLLPEPTR